MKRVFLLILASAVLLISTGCGLLSGKDVEPQSQTAEFYKSINLKSFYYKATVNKNNQTYTYTQAVDADSCTSIEDHTNDTLDKYIITEGDLMHGLDFENKRYDTLQTKNTTKFVFGENHYSEFNNPTSTETVYVDNLPFLCETFNSVDERGNTVGEIKYYFDTASTLTAVEWYEGGNCVALMVMLDYSETIPKDIHLSIPEGFTAGMFSSEQEFDPWADER